jgi:hypothetical protein
MLVPYFFIAMLALAYAAALVVAATTSLFPVFLLVCQLFATVTAGSGPPPNADDTDLEETSDSGD